MFDDVVTADGNVFNRRFDGGMGTTNKTTFPHLATCPRADPLSPTHFVVVNPPGGSGGTVAW